MEDKIGKGRIRGFRWWDSKNDHIVQNDVREVVQNNRESEERTSPANHIPFGYLFIAKYNGTLSHTSVDMYTKFVA